MNLTSVGMRVWPAVHAVCLDFAYLELQTSTHPSFHRKWLLTAGKKHPVRYAQIIPSDTQTILKLAQVRTDTNYVQTRLCTSHTRAYTSSFKLYTTMQKSCAMHAPGMLAACTHNLRIPGQQEYGIRHTEQDSKAKRSEP